MNFNRISRIMVCLLVAVSSCKAVWADNLTIGVETTDYFPQYLYKNKTLTGYAGEIFSLFASTHGHTITYKAYPIKRLLDVYMAGEVDLKYPDNKFWAQDAKAGKDIKYSGAVVNFIDGVLVKPANKGKGVAALKRLGTLRGFTAFDYFDHIKAGTVKIKENNNLSALMQQTQNGRVDGAYFNVAVANYYLNNKLKTPGSLVFDSQLPHTKTFYSVSSMKRPDIIKQFNQFLKDKASDIQAIKNKLNVEDGVN
jgi:ABC-type amino acid transport substrate-binding protein